MENCPKCKNLNNEILYEDVIYCKRITLTVEVQIRMHSSLKNIKR